jgi:hypothetical protein
MWNAALRAFRRHPVTPPGRSSSSPARRGERERAIRPAWLGLERPSAIARPSTDRRVHHRLLAHRCQDGSKVSCWPASAGRRLTRVRAPPTLRPSTIRQRLWLCSARSRRQPRLSACRSTIRPSRTSLGTAREKIAPHHLRFFFQKPKAILWHLEGEGRFLSGAPCLYWGNGSECLA